MIQGIHRFFHFSYLRQDVRGMPQIHELRDGHAFAELAMLLRTNECHYGGLLLNYPVPVPHVKTPDLTSTDLLVLTTRPPLNDDELDSRPIRRSGTPLERIVLETVRQAFRICRRSYVMLSEEMARRLPDPYRNRGEMEFTLNGPACYKRYRMPYTKKKTEHQWCVDSSESPRTSAFVLFTRMPNGAMLLNAFSMDGPGTLIWCYLLRSRHPHVIDSPRFVMAEMIPSGSVPERPPSLSFADNWSVDILLDHPLT
jgi:hypothetical protein